MRAKVRRRHGRWCLWIVVKYGRPGEYEVLIDTYSDLEEAHGVARFIIAERERVAA